jgi:hypothetical protein
LKKKDETTMTISHTEPDGTKVTSKPITMDELKKLPEKVAQMDLDGNKLKLPYYEIEQKTSRSITINGPLTLLKVSVKTLASLDPMSTHGKEIAELVMNKMRFREEVIDQVQTGDFDRQAAFMVIKIKGLVTKAHTQQIEYEFEDEEAHW